MAAKKVPGAAECIMLLRHADRVASICNDVIGDICGVVSGAAAATIAGEILTAFQWSAGLGELGHVCSGSRSHRRREGSGKVYGDAFVYIHCVSAGKVIHWLKCIPQLLLPVRGGKKVSRLCGTFEYSGAYTGP